MSFPLKPFLFLVNRSSALRVNYFEGCIALVEYIGPIIPEKSSYPEIPYLLRNWTCTELEKILKVKESAIFWSILENEGLDRIPAITYTSGSILKGDHI